MVPQLRPHAADLRSVAMSSTGELLATGSELGRVVIVAVADERILRIADAHADAVTALAFRRDDQQLVSAGRDGLLCVHDLTRNAEPVCERRDGFDFHAAAFTSDGRLVASGRRHRGARANSGGAARVDVIRVDRPRTVGRVRNPVTMWTAVFDLSVSANADRVALRTAGAQFVTDVEGSPTRRYLRKPMDRAFSFALTADGQRLVFPDDGALHVYDVESQTESRQIRDPDFLGLYMDAIAIDPSDRLAVLVSGDKTHLRTYDLESGSHVDSVASGRAGLANAMAFSGDGRRFALVGLQGHIEVFDVAPDGALTGLPLHMPVASVAFATFSEDGRRAFLGASSGLYEVDLDTGAVRFVLGATAGMQAWHSSARAAASWRDLDDWQTGWLWTWPEGRPREQTPDLWSLSRPVRYFARTAPRLVDAAGEVFEFDPSTGPHSLGTLSTVAPRSAILSDDGELLVAASEAQGTQQRTFEESFEVVRIYDIDTGRLGAELHHPVPPRALALSADATRLVTGEASSFLGNNVVAMGLGYHVRVWDTATGTELHTFEGPPDGVESVAISPDGRLVLAGGANADRFDDEVLDRSGTLWVYDLDTGQRVRTLYGHRDAVRSIDVSPDGRLALTSSRDGTARLWNLTTGDSVSIVVANGEWLLYSDDGLFAASRRGHTLVSAVRGRRHFGIDQLAPRNNRPGRLLQRMGLGQREVIAHFESRFERRLRRLGLREEDLTATLAQAPLARIDGVDVVGGTATLRFSLEGKGQDLLRYNVYANDVPLLGAGVAVDGRRFEGSVDVPLLEGHNKLEVSVLDVVGVESLRAQQRVTGPASPRGDLYFVGFGVSRYQDADLDLKWAHQDVLDLATTLKGDQDRFAHVHVRVRVDDDVTTDSIRDAAAFLAPATAHDTVVLFVAGHGTYAHDEEAAYYYLTHDADVDRLTETAAPFETIEALLQGIQPRHKLFLLDTCESGVRDDDGPRVASADGGRGLVPRTTRGLEVDPVDEDSHRPSRVDRERFIYNDLERRTGAIVMASSRGTEVSYEQDSLRNGVFTEAVLEALRGQAADADGDEAIDSDELRHYVAARVSELTDGRQNPTVDRDNREIRIVLPRFGP